MTKLAKLALQLRELSKEGLTNNLLAKAKAYLNFYNKNISGATAHLARNRISVLMYHLGMLKNGNTLPAMYLSTVKKHLNKYENEIPTLANSMGSAPAPAYIN